jgi:serine/threonine protein kinase
MTLKAGAWLCPDEIGAGGMGERWKARDTRLGRIVAIKKVKEQHTRSPCIRVTPQMHYSNNKNPIVADLIYKSERKSPGPATASPRG